MSLLFLEEEEKTIPVHTDSYKDLALDELIEAITSIQTEQNIIKKVFNEIPVSCATVTYRQQILKDFISNDTLYTGMQKVLLKLKVLKEYRDSYRIVNMAKSSVWELLDFLQELEVYVEVIEEFSELFKGLEIEATGLKKVAASIESIKANGGIEHIKEDVKDFKVEISQTKSLTLGVNLSPDLYPEEVKILGFYNGYFKIDSPTATSPMIHGTTQYGREAIMKCLTKEIEKHLSKCVKRMKKVFKQYIDMDGFFLVDLYDELLYYLLVAKFWRKLKNDGYSLCIPDVCEDSKDITIKSMYNIRLAFQKNENIVKNDFNFSSKERVYILTGPNRGGKTILTQGIGLIAYMASIGLFVAADSYKGFTVKKIMTHFPADENKTMNYGRLGEEAVRIQQIVKESDENTLVLLNETYSTTCASDGLYLARDLVHVLKQKNVSTIFNTHIHELAKSTQEMNEWEGDSDVISIVMEIKENKNTFKLLRSEPNPSSYARLIAERYGITYEQMMRS